MRTDILLQELKYFIFSFDGTWLAGDFNVTFTEDEKKGRRSHGRDSEEFQEAIRELELMVPLIHGRNFTWSNKRE